LLDWLRQADNRFTVMREFSGGDHPARPGRDEDDVANEVGELMIAGTTP
jgi:hypothetical protein